MSFAIELGITQDNPFKVNKSYTIVSPPGGVIIEPTSTINQLNPVFKINYNDAYININYVIASFLGRKYNCVVDYQIGKIMTLHCTVDYLSSFDLSKCPITVLRNGGIGKPTKVIDNKLPIVPNVKQVRSTIAVNNALTTADLIDGMQPYVYILTVQNGGTNND